MESDKMAKDGKTVINAWNEWDPLGHIIVGRVDKSMTVKPTKENPIDVPLWAEIFHTMDEQGVENYETAYEQIEGFASLLEGRGIRVDRPEVMDFSQEVQTPDWVHNSMFGVMPPRDILICFGNEILETTMSFRDRWYEFICYRPLLEKYFKEDPNFVWEAAPKPRLTEATYEPGYWHNYQEVWSEEVKKERHEAQRWLLTDHEPLFDAADMMRYGKDIFVQPSLVTNGPGIDWLRRHLEPKGFRLHEVSFGGDTMSIHLDCQFFSPHPGLVLQSPNLPSITPKFHEFFKINGWEVVVAEASSGQLPDPSHWLAYNVLSLDPNTICVEAAEGKVMDQLDKMGFEVIPVEFANVAPFGGGLHCSTVDIVREVDCEDYFPKQIEGF
jgi:glycine amidinotransferase